MKRVWQYALLAAAIVLTGAALTNIYASGGPGDVRLYRDDAREFFLNRGKMIVKAYDDGGEYLDASMKIIYRNDVWMDIMEYSTWHIDPENMRYKVSEITSCNLAGETQET